MFPSWFNYIVEKMNVYKNRLGEVELHVVDQRRNFREVFERNAILEREISERVQELHQANKSLITLKHIWSTMNSSEPLAEVLSTIVDGLSENIGYLYCLMFQVYEYEGEAKLKLRAMSDNDLSSRFKDLINDSIYSYSIGMNQKENILVQSIKSNKIINIKKFRRIFTGSDPEINDKNLEEIDVLLGNRSISILPIMVQERPFGCMAVISIRNEITSTEENFLSLFAGQVELAITIAGLFEQLRDQAITDSLTGLYNRRYFDQCLSSEVDRSLRLKQPFTLITLDLDHLKRINDEYGHSAGDAAIRYIGTILKQNARSVDIPARFGGEEFAVILPGIDVEGGLIAAERIKTAIESHPVEGVGTVTASIGVATFLKHTQSIGELLELVDQAMYRAKRNGRNQVCLAVKLDEVRWQQLALESFIDILAKHKIPVEADIAKELTEKLKAASLNEKSLPNLLYYITDSLIQTYQPFYHKRDSEEKISMIDKIAKEINLPEAEIERINLATLLNDFINLMLPENILAKAGPLTDEERETILHHPIIAAREILKPIKSASSVACLIEHYNEFWDGSGSPDNLSGDDIPIGSRIIHIVDSYFAMTSDRPYRQAFTKEEALKILKEGANVKWDGNLVNIFVNILEKERKPV